MWIIYSYCKEISTFLTQLLLPLGIKGSQPLPHSPPPTPPIPHNGNGGVVHQFYKWLVYVCTKLNQKTGSCGNCFTDCMKPCLPATCVNQKIILRSVGEHSYVIRAASISEVISFHTSRKNWPDKRRGVVIYISDSYRNRRSVIQVTLS